LASLVSATADTLKSLKPAAKTGTNKLWVRPEQQSSDADLDTSASDGINEQHEKSEQPGAHKASNDNTAVAPDAKQQRKKLWVRPDSPEPSQGSQDVRSTSSSDDSQTDATPAEDGTPDPASNAAAETTQNATRTDED
jgi:hypothetical protein